MHLLAGVRPLALVLVPALTGVAAADDAKDLKDKDPLVRLAAVERIAETKGEDAEKLLLRALKDDDWEVVERAAVGLAEVGGDKAVASLTALAWNGPVRRVRTAAARSLAQLDAEAGLKGIARKLSGDRARRAADAYGQVAAGHAPAKPSKALEKLLKSKETLVRAAAARALVLATDEGRGEVLAELLDSGYVAVAAAALEGAADDPRAEQLAPLVALLRRARLPDVLERRALVALVRTVGVLEGAAANEALFRHVEGLAAAGESGIAARGPRLAGHAVDEEWFDPAPLPAATARARVHSGVAARAAAAWALRLGDAPTCLAVARAMGEADESPRVRRAALAAALVLEDLDDDAQRAWIIARLAADEDAAVREDLAVALAVRDHPDAAAALGMALQDPAWSVVACAAVSLGRTRHDGAVARLAALARDADWRKRGAAVVGLSHCFDVQAVPHVVDALTDPEPLVRRAAHAWLSAINLGQPLPPDPEPWRAWWTENEKRIRLRDPAEDGGRREEFSSSASFQDVYRGIDVLVLESRGDHIQNVLGHLELEFRMTRAGRLPEDGCDATGVFVANCTGEMEHADVERLQWFVRVGGYFFGSCWAVHETIERVAPGAVRKLETLGEVMDRVTATPAAAGSPYLEGVFADGVVPIYQLEGAHLIEVLAPERVEVLVDSAECAERWGDGNLACWFSFGHGKILDSVNHFDLQGFARATGLKKPEDRMAYAMDHMGATYARLRETRGAKFWTSNPRAEQQIRDLSVFRLITNFVRLRRIEGY